MHRAELIMQEVLANITGLTTTGANVERSRVYKIDALPALTLEQGEDAVADESTNMAFIDRLLSIRIVAHAKAVSDFDQVLNTIREEVYIALMADRTQGLGFVIDTMPMGDDEPEFSADSEKPVGKQVINFAIHYRHSVTNPGA